MRNSLYILILICLFSCKSTKINSESNEKIELTSKKTEIEFYENGFLKSIGQINSEYLLKSARIGLWSEFYENGKLKETGEYKTDFYTNCCIAGPCEINYSYKVGKWNYYHENGKLKASGIYRIEKKQIDTSCEGGDQINFGFINENWKFYNKKGIEIKLSKKEIKEIEKKGIIDEFDFD